MTLPPCGQAVARGKSVFYLIFKVRNLGSAASLVAEERTVKGSYMGSAVPRRDIPRFIALYQAGRLPVDWLLTRTITLDEINAAFDALAKGEAVRQVIRFGD